MKKGIILFLVLLISTQGICFPVDLTVQNKKNNQIIAEDNNPLSSLYSRIFDLEKLISQMTAQQEEQAHQIKQLQEKIRRMEEQKQVLTSLTSTDEKKTLSTMPLKVSPVSAPISPKEAYENAYKLLNAQKYTEAQQALEAFLATYPEDSLAGNAQYWLGETFYVREMYEQSAAAFASGFKKYKKSAKGADNLLKLGLSLKRLKKNKEACVAFKSMKKEFPKASNVLLSRAQKEMEQLACQP